MNSCSNRTLVNVIIVFWAITLMLFFSSGCIVVGFDPKTEIRTHEVQETPNNTSNVLEEDPFARTISTVEKPEITVLREKGKMIRVEVCAAQTFQYRYITTGHREKWEIEDGRAWSIGIIPGNGPILFTGKLSSTDTNAWDVVSFTIATPIGNALMLGIPTIASLFGGLGETDSVASFGLVGACAFDTCKPVGERRVEQEMEKTFGTICRSMGNRQGLSTCVMTTVEIPAIWYRQTVFIAPKFTNGHIESSATLILPTSVPLGAECTVSLSFMDESGKYGSLLTPYEGMTVDFSL